VMEYGGNITDIIVCPIAGVLVRDGTGESD
jgi:hypothetical protein